MTTDRTGVNGTTYPVRRGTNRNSLTREKYIQKMERHHNHSHHHTRVQVEKPFRGTVRDEK